ncbi:nuclear transport factor 2 family protein [Nesterenkonia haasae]|uniref:nuclear transport factor 2 family protein n=1 Tax=Nesterenkonia haasae TaxID=2587813 RepID=UPI001391BBBE|nr:nuclear transport factor 2 family protein [Nesterenkonia haasae]
MARNTGFDYDEYVEAFNRGDDDALVDGFFAEDVFFAGNSMTLQGREELRAFLHNAHNGVRETLRHQAIAREDNELAVEVDMDFHATDDRPDFVFGPLRAGEHMTVKFFCFYQLSGDKISSLKTATWAPNREVTVPPTSFTTGTLGKRTYLNYVLAFNSQDTDGFLQFYDDEIQVKLPSFDEPLHGKAAVKRFYENMYHTVHEEIDVRSVILDEGGIAADVVCRFTAVDDAHDFVLGPLLTGESYEADMFVHYALRNGKINRVSVARRSEVRHIGN